MYGLQWTSAGTGTSLQLLVACWAGGNGDHKTRLFNLISLSYEAKKL